VSHQLTSGAIGFYPLRGFAWIKAHPEEILPVSEYRDATLTRFALRGYASGSRKCGV